MPQINVRSLKAFAFIQNLLVLNCLFHSDQVEAIHKGHRNDGDFKMTATKIWIDWILEYKKEKLT